jgi:hypothetical protein
MGREGDKVARSIGERVPTTRDRDEREEAPPIPEGKGFKFTTNDTLEYPRKGWVEGPGGRWRPPGRKQRVRIEAAPEWQPDYREDQYEE